MMRPLLFAMLLQACGVAPLSIMSPSHGVVKDATGRPLAGASVSVESSPAALGKCERNEVLASRSVRTDEAGRWTADGEYAFQGYIVAADGIPLYCQHYVIEHGSARVAIGPEREPETWTFAAAPGVRASVQDLRPDPPRLLPAFGVIGNNLQGLAGYFGGAWFFIEEPGRFGLRAHVQPGALSGSGSLGLQFLPRTYEGTWPIPGLDLSARIDRSWWPGRPHATRLGPELGVNLLMLRLTVGALVRVQGDDHKGELIAVLGFGLGYL